MKTMKQIMMALLLCISIAGFGQAPTITGFSPASGPVGTVVTITGTNLSSPTAFTIGGVSAIVVSDNGSSLVGMVMPGAATGSISVTTSGGTASGSGSYTVAASPYPSVQQGPKLVGTGAFGDTARQGNSVAISADGNTAIIGGPTDSNAQGAAWVYTRSGGVWAQQGAKLVGTGSVGPAVQQGYSVAISADGNTAMVGGRFDNSGVGAAWIFTRSGGVWSQQGSKLVGSGVVGGDAAQGSSVSLSADGNTATIGGPFDNNYAGAVWIFTRSGGVWTQQGAKLVGTGTAVAYNYHTSQGYSVALSADGNTLIEGGPYDSINGAAWVFTRSGSTWAQQGNKLIGTGVVVGYYVGQGSSVALSANGNTAIVGGQDDNGNAGAAWVYIRSGSTWTQQGSKLVGTGAAGVAKQGSSVSLSADGNTAVVGGYYNNNGVGAIWRYTRSGSTWTQRGSDLVGTDAVGYSGEGTSVSISADGSTFIAGGPADSLNTGAAWIFVDSALVSPAGPNQSICISFPSTDTVVMAAIGTGTWTALAGNPSVTVIINPSSPITGITAGFSWFNGVYGYVWTTASGSDTVSVTVNYTPTKPHLYSWGSCLGADTLIAGALTGDSIEWLLNGSTVYTSSAADSFYMPGTAGLYTVRAINSGGCASVLSDTLTIYAVNVSITTADTNVVPGQADTLTAVGSPAGGNYYWSPSAGISSIDSATVYGYPTSSIDYCVTYTWSGCYATNCQWIHVSSSTAGPNQTICLGDTAITTAATGTGTWSALAGNPSYTQFFNPAVPVTHIEMYGASNGIYKYLWTTSSGQDTLTVTVNICSEAGNDQTICINSTATMNAFGTGTWTALAGNPHATTITNPTSPTTTISGFTVNGVYGFSWGTAPYDTMYVTVDSIHPSSVGITASQSTICSGAIDNFNAIPTNGGSYPTYRWYINGNLSWYPFSPLEESLYGTGTDSIWVEMLSDGCTNSSWVSSPHLTITVLPTPDAPAITADGTCLGADSILLSGSYGTDTIEWYASGVPVFNSGFDSTYIPAITGAYTATVRASDGCISQSSAPVAVSTCSCHVHDSIIGSYIAGSYSDYRFQAVLTGINYPIIKWYVNGNYYGVSPELYVNANDGFNSISFTAIDSLTGCSISDTLTPFCILYDSTSYVNLGSDQYQFTAYAAGTSYATYQWLITGNGAFDSLVANTHSDNSFIFTLQPNSNYVIISQVTDSVEGCYYRDSVGIGTFSGIGPNQTICLGDTAIMTAATGVGIWSVLPGNPANTYILDATWTNTNIEFGSYGTPATVPGVYRYLWTTSASTDTLTVTINNCNSSAGPDQLHCMNGLAFTSDTIQMAAIGTGTWSILSSNPHLNTIIDSPSSPTTLIYAYPFEPGRYGFIWTTAYGPDTVYVTLDSIDLVFGLTVSQPVVCRGQSDSFVVNTFPGVTSLSYAWYINSSLVDTTQTYVDPSMHIGDTVSVVVTSLLGCINNRLGSDTLVASLTVDHCHTAGPDQTVCAGDTAFITAATGSGVWSIPAGNPSYSQFFNPSLAVTHIELSGAVTGIYKYIWTTSSGPDTLTVTVNNCNSAGPNQNLCLGDTDIAVAATGTGTWSVLPGNPATTNFVTYWMANTHIEFGGGGIPATVPGVYRYLWTTSSGVDTLTVSINNCATDTVWPGDADANHVVDNNDLLTIGLGYDSTGPIRVAQGIVWQADPAADWSHDFTIYAPLVNFVHADCNGDGTINADDTLAIVTNFGLTHLSDGAPQAWRSGIAGLYLSVSSDTVLNGDTLITTILLGNAAMPVSAIYGLAFTFRYDPLVVDSNSESFSFISSWLGTGANSISLHKDNTGVGQIKAAITGIDHQNRSGYGAIATMRSIITTDNINGKDLSYYTDRMYITGVTAIDALGNPVQLNDGIDSAAIGFIPNGINEIGTTHLSIYPNPAASRVTIAAQSQITEISMTDVLGQNVLAQTGNDRSIETIDISQLAVGVYTIHVSTASGAGTAKLVISR